jgi:hypothetical protein
LPHQPLIDRQLIAIGRPIEFPRLAREVLQDGTAFKEGEWRAVRTVMIASQLSSKCSGPVFGLLC